MKEVLSNLLIKVLIVLVGAIIYVIHTEIYYFESLPCIINGLIYFMCRFILFVFILIGEIQLFKLIKK